MKHQRFLLGLFIVACVAQAAVPVAMIFRAERTLAHGDVYRFRCAPVDPMDPFRGRYVALGFAVETERVPLDEPLAHGDQAFATLGVGSDGFAHIVRLTRAPAANATAIRVRVRYPQNGTALAELPFDRYFLNETIAPEAERTYRKALGDGDVAAWAEVRVLGTTPTLVGLSIDGVAAEDYVRAVTPR